MWDSVILRHGKFHAWVIPSPCPQKPDNIQFKFCGKHGSTSLAEMKILCTPLSVSNNIHAFSQAPGVISKACNYSLQLPIWYLTEQCYMLLHNPVCKL